MFKFSSNIKNYILRIAPLAIMLIMFGFILNEEQNKKEVLYELFKSEISSSIQKETMHFIALKDINCSLTDVAVEDRELLQMYLKVYEENLSDKLDESYVSDKTKKQLKSALEYIPCDCKTET